MIAIQGRTVSSAAPSNNQTLKWNGTNWYPANDDNTLYAAGTGISLTGNTFSHPMHSGDISGSTSLSVIAIQGRAVSTTIPSSGNVLCWNGSKWIPSIPMPLGTSGQTLRHDGNNWIAVSSLFNNGSNIGINTTNPKQKLHIEGNIRIPQTTSTTGIIYSDSIPFIHSYRNGIYVGNNAGNFSMTSVSNIGIGQNSLNAITTGTENLAIGNNTLKSNSTGDYNIGIGYQSLYNNSTGSTNIAIGSEVLKNNLTGTGNTSIGTNSMRYNDEGNYNSGIGFFALYNNSKGNNNATIGDYSMMNNTIGNSNSAVGYYALSENITGNYNTALGDFAASSNLIGNSNTAVGSHALQGNQTGDSNTSIGNYSGVILPYLTNSTAIGNKAVALNSNSIYLGNSAVVYIGGQVGWSTLSDGRYKNNINDYKIGLGFIMKLHPVSYEYIDNGQKGITYNGFIAQEVEKILDENGWQFSGLCKPAHEKDRYSIRYAEFVVPLVNAVQEQQLILEKYLLEMNILRNENLDLKNNYQTLSNQYADLQKQVDELKIMVKNTK